MADSSAADEIEAFALRLLARREHTRRELQHKLLAKGFERHAVDAVILGLVEAGALDESRFVEVYVAERIRKGFGPLRIRAELRERGIPDDLVDAGLDGDMDWEADLQELHDRRFGDGAPRDRDEYAKRGRFLQQRGFPAEMIRRRLHFPD